MATLNISLPDTMKNFVEEEVSAGGYQTTSEYFRTLIREAQDRKAKIRLEALLLESMNGSDTASMTESDWGEVRREIRERVTHWRGGHSGQQRGRFIRSLWRRSLPE